MDSAFLLDQQRIETLKHYFSFVRPLQEKHLKEAIETRQFYGSQGATFIPTPEVAACKETAHHVYRQDVTQPDEYIRVSGRFKLTP